jgi:hypothetical protein
MSLISKPFDDSGVEMGDDIARYGMCISRRIEQFRQKYRPQFQGAESFGGLAVAMVLCDTMSEIIDKASHEPYRSECARAADTMFFAPVNPDQLPAHPPAELQTHSRELVDAINAILADDQLLPSDGSVPLQTVLLAMVWCALSFAMESLPLDQARARIRHRMLGSQASFAVH